MAYTTATARLDLLLQRRTFDFLIHEHAHCENHTKRSVEIAWGVFHGCIAIVHSRGLRKQGLQNNIIEESEHCGSKGAYVRPRVE